MALIVLCVIFENITSLMRGAKFWEKWEDTKYPEDNGCTDAARKGEKIAGFNP